MKRLNLRAAAVGELVDRFVELCIAQDKALLRDKIREVNRIFDGLKEIEHELKTRQGDQRQALMALYDHPNMQVQVKAAKATLAVAPQAARAVLEAVKAANWQPQSLEAGMSLWNLDSGVYKPK